MRSEGWRRSIRFKTPMLTSYNKYSGMVTKTNVIRSGGVMMAATTMMMTKACFR